MEDLDGCLSFFRGDLGPSASSRVSRMVTCFTAGAGWATGRGKGWASGWMVG